MTQRLDYLREAQRLQIHAGRIQSLVARGPQIEVTWRTRGSGEQVRDTFDVVVNCTGPDYAIARSTVC